MINTSTPLTILSYWISFFVIISLLAINGKTLADATINFSGTLINAPGCTINGNNTVDVNFGDEVVTKLVDGNNYKQQIDFSMDCVSIANNGLTISISGTGASFDSDYISTNRTELGIRLFNGDAGISNGAKVRFTWPDLPKLYAAPIAEDPESLKSGEFFGTASLILNYQ